VWHFYGFKLPSWACLLCLACCVLSYDCALACSAHGGTLMHIITGDAEAANVRETRGLHPLPPLLTRGFGYSPPANGGKLAEGNLFRHLLFPHYMLSTF